MVLGLRSLTHHHFATDILRAYFRVEGNRRELQKMPKTSRWLGLLDQSFQKMYRSCRCPFIGTAKLMLGNRQGRYVPIPFGWKARAVSRGPAARVRQALR